MNIIIEVAFDSSKKVYKYLLINPHKYKINKDKPLIYQYGMGKSSTTFKRLTSVKVYKVESIPSIVTSQIVLLDDCNNIDIQKIGGIYSIEAKDTTKEWIPTDTLDIIDRTVVAHKICNRFFKTKRRVF